MGCYAGRRAAPVNERTRTRVAPGLIENSNNSTFRFLHTIQTILAMRSNFYVVLELKVSGWFNQSNLIVDLQIYFHDIISRNCISLPVATNHAVAPPSPTMSRDRPPPPGIPRGGCLDPDGGRVARLVQPLQQPRYRGAHS